MGARRRGVSTPKMTSWKAFWRGVSVRGPGVDSGGMTLYLSVPTRVGGQEKRTAPDMEMPGADPESRIDGLFVVPGVRVARGILDVRATELRDDHQAYVAAVCLDAVVDVEGEEVVGSLPVVVTERDFLMATT